ncbi:unnamed protein product [Owenia fusiformis]|uniref:Uncharacterized protein n=1 Tax=Owenia fusiformis TaxID=6347 RepID=A0A8J1UVZ9_OWEFU|nr:unnamed protein product [Owenia fusiformis]
MDCVLRYCRLSYYFPMRPVRIFEEWMFGHVMLTVYFLLFSSWLNFTNDHGNELAKLLYDININPIDILQKCPTVQDIVNNQNCFNPSVTSNQERDRTRILDAVNFKGKLIHCGITERAIQQCLLTICKSIECIDSLTRDNLNIERLKRCDVTMDMLTTLTTNPETDAFYNKAFMDSLNWTFWKAMSEYSFGIFGFCTYVLGFVMCQIICLHGSIVGNIRQLECNSRTVEDEIFTQGMVKRSITVLWMGMHMAWAIVLLMISLACYGWNNIGFLVILNVCFKAEIHTKTIYIEQFVHVLICALWVYSFQCVYAWYMTCLMVFGLTVLQCILMLSETSISFEPFCSIDAKRLLQVPSNNNDEKIFTVISDILMCTENDGLLQDDAMRMLSFGIKAAFVGTLGRTEGDQLELIRRMHRVGNIFLNSSLCKSMRNVRFKNINSSELISHIIVPSLRHNKIQSVEIINNYALTDNCDLISDSLIAENYSLKVLDIRFERKSGFQHMFYWLCYGPRSNIKFTSKGVKELLQACVKRLETAPLEAVVITGYTQACVKRLETAPLEAVVITGYTPADENIEDLCALLRSEGIYVLVEPYN